MQLSTVNTAASLSIFLPLFVNRSVYDIAPILGYIPCLIYIFYTKNDTLNYGRIVLGILTTCIIILSVNAFETPKIINVIYVFSIFFILLAKKEKINFQRRDVKLLNALTIFIFLLGVCQMMNIVELNSRDNFYYTNLLPFQFNRMTSVFIEPSACGLFFIMMTILYEKVVGKIYFIGYIGVILSFSTQALIILVLLKIQELIFTRRSNLKIIFLILLFGATYQVTGSQIIERISGNSFGHRVSGPVIAIETIEESFEFAEILLGAGIGSLSGLTNVFVENAPTTHNFYIDVLYEGGLIGILLLIASIIVMTGWFNSMNIMILFLGVGYRSPEIISVAILSQVNQGLFRKC